MTIDFAARAEAFEAVAMATAPSDFTECRKVAVGRAFNMLALLTAGLGRGQDADTAAVAWSVDQDGHWVQLDSDDPTGVGFGVWVRARVSAGSHEGVSTGLYPC